MLRSPIERFLHSRTSTSSLKGLVAAELFNQVLKILVDA